MPTPWWVPVLAFAGVVVAAAIGGLAGVFGQPSPPLTSGVEVQRRGIWDRST
jgi:hypothetical protein